MVVDLLGILTKLKMITLICWNLIRIIFFDDFHMNFLPFQRLQQSSSSPAFREAKPQRETVFLFMLCWLSFTRARSPSPGRLGSLEKLRSLALCKPHRHVVSAFLTKTKAQNNSIF